MTKPPRKPTILPDDSGANRTVYKKPQIPQGEAFVTTYLSMLESSAWAALSLPARKIYDRLMIEHMRHGGTRNGQLPCTYSDFENYGVRRKSIAAALDELEALAFIKRTKKGHLVPDGKSGTPSLYLITSLSEKAGRGYLAPTFEWRQFQSIDEAKLAAKRFTASAKPKRQVRAKRLSKCGASQMRGVGLIETNQLGALEPLN
jgi:hypothetical protein